MGSVGNNFAQDGWGDDVRHMMGMEGSGDYIVLCWVGGFARLGIRLFAKPQQWRIRLEPSVRPDRKGRIMDTLTPMLKRWQSPDQSQWRFAKMAVGDDVLKSAVEQALLAMYQWPDGDLVVNEAAPDWFRPLLERLGIGYSLDKPAPEAAVIQKPKAKAGATPKAAVIQKPRGKAGATPKAQPTSDPGGIELTGEAPAEDESTERQRLIELVRSRRLPGWTMAARWTLATLRKKAGQTS